MVARSRHPEGVDGRRILPRGLIALDHGPAADAEVLASGRRQYSAE